MPRIPKDTPKPSTRDKKIKQTTFNLNLTPLTFDRLDEYIKYSSLSDLEVEVGDVSFDIESFYPKGMS